MLSLNGDLWTQRVVLSKRNTVVFTDSVVKPP